MRWKSVSLSLIVAITVAAAVFILVRTLPGKAQAIVTVALDVDITNGSGPCDPIDATAAYDPGDTFDVARASPA